MEDRALCSACDKHIRPHLTDLRKHGQCNAHIKNCHEKGQKIFFNFIFLIICYVLYEADHTV